MKNLQIGDNDLIGNRFNGHDLHQYLRQRGVVSDHIVRSKQSDDPNTYVLAEEIQDRFACNNMIQNVEKYYSTHALHYPFSFSLFRNRLFLDADIIHYHLIQNYFFNMNLLPAMTALKPSVWTIHDPWIMTGHCIYPLDCDRWKTGCGNCPHPGVHFPIAHDTTALNWEIKREILKNSRIDLIVASEFMYGMVKKSPLLSHLDVHYIPFGVDLKRFTRCDGRDARNRLGIPEGNFVICFRADPSPFKGFECVKDSLNRLSSNVPATLLSVGCTSKLELFRDRFQVIDMGWLTDDNIMIDVYRAADVFLMPSRAEAFGMMAMEAMACGKPVIVFEGTSLPKVTYAPEGGIAVPQGDVAALTHELEQLISNREKRLKLGEQARILAEQHYDKDVYVSKMIDLYKEVIDKRIITDRSKYIISQLKKIADQPCPHKSEGISADSRSNVGSALAPAASTAAQIVPVVLTPLAELELIKSSAYFKVYDRLRKRRHLRFVSNAVIKPALRASWWVYKKCKTIGL